MSDSPMLGTQPLQHPSALQYRVGDLSIDVGRQRVTRGERAIALPKLSYELLMALVRGAPNLVSLETLMEEVWPKVVVSPETLSQRIKLLRDALGDDPRAPRYVEGLRGRGYRLIPRVELDDGTVAPESSLPASTGPAAASTTTLPPPSQSPDIAVPSATPRPRRQVLLWGSVIAALILLGGVFLVRQLRHAELLNRQTSIAVVAVQPRAVAVLPFDNLSSEPDNDYVALGVADSVLHQLAGVPELIVVARSSSFALGKPTPEAREAGRKLGVRYLVTGSVQRAGKMLRVTAQLTDTANNVALWSLKLDRTIDDVFALQDQLAQRVAQQLDVTLRNRTAVQTQYGTDAYLAFQRGRALIESRRVSDVEESVRQFSRAIELAPTFATAIAELARAKMQLGSLQTGPTARTTALQPELEALIERAIHIDPMSGEPYFMRAGFRLERGDLSGAEDDFRKGLDFAPNFGPGLRGYAQYLSDHGRYDEALLQLDRARLVDPLSAENHYAKGQILRTALYRYEDAAALYLQALSVQPDFYPAYTRLAQVQWELGRLAQAIRYAERSVAIEPSVGWTRERLVWFYVDADDLPAARDVLRGYLQGAPEMASSEALLCYRAGRLESVANILRKSIHDPDFTGKGYGLFLALDALIERAVASRDPTEARQLIKEGPELEKVGADLAVVEGNFPQVMQLAILEHAVGNRAMADDIARRSLQYLDGNPKVQLIGGWDEWARASASAILGRDDEALGHLEKLVQSGFRMGSWDRIERDVAFAALRATPRFKAIVAGSKVWLENEQQQITQLRSSGEVPRRTTDQRTPNGC